MRIGRSNTTSLWGSRLGAKLRKLRLRRKKRVVFSPLRAATMGAAMMYFYDPTAGRRRRARLREKSSHAFRATRLLAAAGARDLANRARGGLHTLRSLSASRQPAESSVLEARVRAKLGRVCSHPHAVEVNADDGRVTLKGPILRTEMEQVLRSLRRVRGVTEVESRLEPHDDAQQIPSLQGGVPRSPPTLLGPPWTPSQRLISSLGGLALLLRSIDSRGLSGLISGGLGSFLLARGIINQPARRLAEMGGGRRGVVVHKNIEVNAPAETVFSLWQHLEDFSRIMSHVKEVRHNEDGSYHWKVTGPGDIGVEWDAELTRLDHGRAIAWRSRPGSPVDNAGMVQFIPVDEDTCRIDVQLSYSPPGGALGHAVAALLGADPKKQLDDDLLRFKSLVESGRTRGRQGPVTLGEILRQS